MKTMEEEAVILTDILGLEDALGTMDFKVCRVTSKYLRYFAVRCGVGLVRGSHLTHSRPPEDAAIRPKAFRPSKAERLLVYEAVSYQCIRP